jgi:hypothetical protein
MGKSSMLRSLLERDVVLFSLVTGWSSLFSTLFVPCAWNFEVHFSKLLL